MKKFIFLILFFNFIFFIKIEKIYANSDFSTNITINSNHKISVKPDISIITLGVLTEDIEITKAQKENSYKILNIIKNLNKFGITNENIKTSSFSIYPKYNYSDYNSPILLGYVISNNISIINNNLDDIAKILNICIDNGANSVGTIEYKVSNFNEYYNKAFLEAVKKGREKINYINNETKFENLELISVYELSSNTNYNYLQNIPKEQYDFLSIFPYEIDIIASVELVFGYK